MKPFLSLKLARCLVITIPTVLALSPTALASSIPLPINVRITNIPELNNEEQIFLSPIDSNIVIANWRDFRLGFRQIGIGRSIDGGATWIDSLIPPGMQYVSSIAGVPSRGRQSDPAMTVDADGNFYMAVLDYLDLAPAINDTSVIVFYKSTDNGLSWSGPVPNVLQFGRYFEDKPFITVDRTGGPHAGNLYVSWTRFSRTSFNRIVFQRSIDGGMSFEDTTVVGPILTSSACGAFLSSAGQFSIPIVSSDGAVHVIWIGFNLDSTVCGNDGFIFHQVTSFDGGQSFGPRSDIMRVSGFTSAPGGIATYSQPAGDADIFGGPFDGHMYISFTNQDSADGLRTDVDFIRSTDNGISWDAPIQINDDPDHLQMDSFHPWLIVNKEGVVIVVFYDHRENPPQYSDFDLFAAYSFDGGLTFTANHRISTASSSPGALLGAQAGREQVWPRDDNGDVVITPVNSRAGLLAEYVGVTSFFDKIVAIWTDSRDGNSECYSATWQLPLLEPRLVSPQSGKIMPASLTLNWATSWKHNQDRYRAEVSTDSIFADPLQLIDSVTVDSNFAQVSVGPTLGSFFWRVKAFNILTGDSSAYSVVRSFVVDSIAPSIATLLAPDDGKVLNITTPSFDWADVPEGDLASYELDLSQDSLFPELQKITITGLSSSDLILPQPLTIEGKYFWRVRALDFDGNQSTSAPFSFSYFDFICGDPNGDRTVNIADITFLIARIFAGGSAPVPLEAGDANGDGSVNIADVTFLIARIFAGGPEPVCP